MAKKLGQNNGKIVHISYLLKGYFCFVLYYKFGHDFKFVSNSFLKKVICVLYEKLRQRSLTSSSFRGQNQVQKSNFKITFV